MLFCLEMMETFPDVLLFFFSTFTNISNSSYSLLYISFLFFCSGNSLPSASPLPPAFREATLPATTCVTILTPATCVATLPPPACCEATLISASSEAPSPEERAMLPPRSNGGKHNESTYCQDYSSSSSRHTSGSSSSSISTSMKNSDKIVLHIYIYIHS